jgi:RNA polymerase sigma factor (sigma-70 family)
MQAPGPGEIAILHDAGVAHCRHLPGSVCPTCRRVQDERDARVMANLGLVGWAVKLWWIGWIRCGIPDRADADQAAMVGLVTASMKFDPARGVKFSTYAGWWLRQSIQNEACNALIRFPRTVLSNPENHQPERVLAARKAIGYKVSLNGEEDSPAAYWNEVACAGKVSNKTDVDDLLRTLPTREAEIVRLRSGYNATLKEIGALFGITKERVRQLHRRAMTRLRQRAAICQRSL